MASNPTAVKNVFFFLSRVVPISLLEQTLSWRIMEYSPTLKNYHIQLADFLFTAMARPFAV